MVDNHSSVPCQCVLWKRSGELVPSMKLRTETETRRYNQIPTRDMTNAGPSHKFGAPDRFWI